MEAAAVIAVMAIAFGTLGATQMVVLQQLFSLRKELTQHLSKWGDYSGY